MFVLSLIGLALLAAVCVAGGVWVVKTVRFNGADAKENDDE